MNAHAHPTRKLGRLAPKRARALSLGTYLTGFVPSHPSRADHVDHPGLSFGLYENDRFRDCGPTSAGNDRRLVTSWLGGEMHAPTQEDVFDLYRRSGNPHFDPATGADDNGVDMQTMLEAMLSGGFAGVRPLAFASVDVHNHGELRAAIAIFGALLLGVTLDVAQQSQTDGGVWSYSPSDVWGGHAVLGAGYSTRPDHETVITWGERVEVASSFQKHQLDEAWVVLWPEHLGAKSFLQGVDVAKLKADYQALTGRAFP